MKTQIARDSFARMSLMREKCDANKECAWCGQRAKWHYFWEDDSSRGPQGQLKAFCSVSCFRTYYS